MITNKQSTRLILLVLGSYITIPLQHSDRWWHKHNLKSSNRSNWHFQTKKKKKCLIDIVVLVVILLVYSLILQPGKGIVIIHVIHCSEFSCHRLLVLTLTMFWLFLSYISSYVLFVPFCIKTFLVLFFLKFFYQIPVVCSLIKDVEVSKVRVAKSCFD